jgi:hypothetical protein
MPELLAYLVHWPDWPPGWNGAGPGLHANAPLELPDGVVHAGGQRVALLLSEEELARKQAALNKYGSQLDVMRSFLTAFLRRTEPYTMLDMAEMERVAATIEKGVEPLPHRPPTPRRHGPAR